MTREELMALTDDALIQKKKKLKKVKIINAFIIGFLVGIIVYSVAKSTWGLVTLIPLYIIYKLVNDGDKNDDLEAVLKERNID